MVVVGIYLVVVDKLEYGADTFNHSKYHKQIEANERARSKTKQNRLSRLFQGV